MRKFTIAILLLVSFPFAQRPAEVEAAARYGYVHVNKYMRYEYVEINDLDKPLYRMSAPTPKLRDKYEYKIVDYEQLWDYEYVPRYASRAVSYIAGYESRPIYEARSETYVAYYDEYPIMATRQESYLIGYNHERVVIGYEPSYSTRRVCTFHWRGSCREWGTESYVSGQRPIYGTRSTPVYGTRTVSYVAGMGRRPVYATRTTQVLVGYERVPVYATRMETVLVGTSKVKVPAGRKPIYDWVKVCSACEIEGYNPPVKVLVGYEKKTVSRPVGEKIIACTGLVDCSNKDTIFIDGAWHEYTGWHKTDCRVNGSVNGAIVANSLCDGGGGVGPQGTPCEKLTPPQVTLPDGSCADPQPDTKVCRNGSVITIKLTEKNLLTDTDPSPCPVPSDDPVDACPDLPGIQPAGTPCSSGDPVDACPDLPGIQPAGTPCSSGDPVDACPDLPGIQPAGPCSNDDPVDACPDLPGIQPAGPCSNDDPVDACPDLPGIQPAGTPCSNDDPVDPDACPDLPGIQPAGTPCSSGGDDDTTNDDQSPPTTVRVRPS